MIAPIRRLLLIFAVVAMFSASARAHVLDEYLQSTLVSIAPGEIRLQINLTPGVEVADSILIHIDVDRDSLISTTEAATYIELLKRDLAARIDGRETALVLTASHFPPPAELRTGHGIAKVEFALAIGRLAGGTHRLTVENRHFPAIGAYLFNAARPQSDAVRIVRQSRNDNQSTGEIEFDYDPPANASPQGGNSNVPSDVSCSGRILQCMGRADFQRLRRAFQRSRRAFGR